MLRLCRGEEATIGGRQCAIPTGLQKKQERSGELDSIEPTQTVANYKRRGGVHHHGRRFDDLIKALETGERRLGSRMKYRLLEHAMQTGHTTTDELFHGTGRGRRT